MYIIINDSLLYYTPLR